MRIVGFAVIAGTFIVSGSARAEVDATGHQDSGKRCFDDLGHPIAGACDDTPPANSGGGKARPAADDDGDSGGGGGARDGFFLRMTLGPGYARHNADIPNSLSATGLFPDELGIRGMAVNFDLEIGGAPVDNLAIYGMLFGNSINKPTVDFGTVTVEADEDTTVSFGGFGAGASYYIGEYLYLDGGLGMAQLTAQTKVTQPDGSTETEKTAETDLGPMVTLGIGAEVKVSDNWSIGGVVKAFAASIPEKDESDIKWRSAGVFAAFSATFF